MPNSVSAAHARSMLEDGELGADEQARLWDEWVRAGELGEIDDDGGPEFP